MKLKYIMGVLALLFWIKPAMSIPMIAPEFTLAIPSGEPVTFYKDSNEKILYVKPNRLELKKYRVGKHEVSAFNIIVIRGIETINPGASLREGSFNEIGEKGYIDAIFELKTAVRDFEELRPHIKAQYPEFANHRVVILPITPGTAFINVTREPGSSLPSGVEKSDEEKLNMTLSGAPVSSEYGGVIPTRIQLSEIDALTLIEMMNQSVPFTNTFGVEYEGKARMQFPPVKVIVKANKRRIYEFVDNHFKAKGGIAFWSFNVDIRKIREKLEERGDLKITIDDTSEKFSSETLMSIADKYVEKFVLHEMNKTNIPLPKHQAKAGEAPEHPKKMSWMALGTQYGRVKAEQFIDKVHTFSFTYNEQEQFSIFANADISDIGTANVVIVDTENSFFSYGMLGIKGIENSEVVKSVNVGRVTFDITIHGQHGTKIKRVAMFSSSENGDYLTVYPKLLEFKYDKSSRKFVKEKAKSITYDFEYVDDFTTFSTNGSIPVGSEFGPPVFVRVGDHIKYRRVTIDAGKSLFTDYPNLRNVKISLTSANSDKINIRLSKNKDKSDYIMLMNGLDYKIAIEAKYIVDNQFKTERNQLEGILDEEGKLISISDDMIPGILEYGGF